MQGSSPDLVGAVAILVVVKRQIGDNNNFYIQLARNLVKKFNIKLYKGIMMGEDNVYKEIYVVFDLNENMYVRYLNLYEDNAYILKPFLAQEFRTELDAITECKECELKCFRVDKIYVLEY